MNRRPVSDEDALLFDDVSWMNILPWHINLHGKPSAVIQPVPAVLETMSAPGEKTTLTDRAKCYLAIKKLEKISIQDLIAKSNYILSRCINEQCMFECTRALYWRHTLPLKDKKKHPLQSYNWALSDEEIPTIKENLKVLAAYADIIFDIVKCLKHRPVKEVLSDPTAFLPPWVVYPLYDARSMGWRMGPGEEYMLQYLRFLKSLSDEELKAYSKAYPCPDYMSDRPFR